MQTLNANPSLLDRTANHIARFVYLKNRSVYNFLALWIIATHLKDQFDNFGYLFVHSPEMACGKTRLLEVLDALVWSSSEIMSILVRR